VQRQAGRQAGAVRFKGDLGVDDLEEELPFAFRINLEFRLPSGLCKELVAFASDFQDEVRCQLV